MRLNVLCPLLNLVEGPQEVVDHLLEEEAVEEEGHPSWAVEEEGEVVVAL